MPSKKQLEKEARQRAQMRTREEREKEVKTLRGKLLLFGFPADHESMIEVEKLFTEYVERGDSVVGKVPFRDFDRTAEIGLYAKRGTECSIVLRYTGDKKAADITERMRRADEEMVRRANALENT